MRLRRVVGERRQLGCQRVRKAAPAPGAGEVEAVEVGDLAVGTIRHSGRREQARRFAGGEIRQEEPEPVAEFGPRENAFHAQRHDQNGGEERSEEQTSELPSRMRISSAVYCLKKKNNT